MRSGLQSARAGRRRRSKTGAGGASALARLGRRFARFRLKHARGTRYPDDLRAAVLALLREVEPDAVYRTCKVTFRQVMTWKAARRSAPAPAKALEIEEAAVRVFSVVDDEPVLRPERQLSWCAVEPELELRLGPWSVSVRLAGGRPEERGRACFP